MNRVETLLGVAVAVFSLFAMWALFSGVGPSRFLPERYAFTTARNAFYFMTIVPVLGLGAIAHSIREKNASELTWGIIILLWSFFSFWWVGLNIYDGSTFFKSSFLGELILTSWPLIVLVVQGVALIIDGTFSARAPENLSVRRRQLLNLQRFHIH